MRAAGRRRSLAGEGRACRGRARAWPERDGPSIGRALPERRPAERSGSGGKLPGGLAAERRELLSLFSPRLEPPVCCPLSPASDYPPIGAQFLSHPANFCFFPPLAIVSRSSDNSRRGRPYWTKAAIFAPRRRSGRFEDANQTLSTGT